MKDTLRELCNNGWTDQDAVWNYKSSGCRPGNMYYVGCRCPREKGHFWGVLPSEKHWTA